jgi:hypothetical protein
MAAVTEMLVFPYEAERADDDVEHGRDAGAGVGTTRSRRSRVVCGPWERQRSAQAAIVVTMLRHQPMMSANAGSGRSLSAPSRYYGTTAARRNR